MDTALQVAEKVDEGVHRVGDRRYIAKDNSSFFKVIEAHYISVRNELKDLEKEGGISSNAVSVCNPLLDRAKLKIDEAKQHIPDLNRHGRKGMDKIGAKAASLAKARGARRAMDDAKVAIDQVRVELENGTLLTNDEPPFQPHFASPYLPKYAHFDEMDNQSHFRKLKDFLRKSDSCNTSNVSMYCAWGPGGMGKTFTLRKLCWDKQLRERFEGGIHYLQLGEDTLDNGMLSRLRGCYSDICTANGQGTQSDWMSMDIGLTLKMLRDALRGKSVLFVLDDVWEHHREYVKDIREMLNEWKHCAVLLSSRREEFATHSDDAISFNYLESTGQQSRGILLSQLEDSVRKEICEDHAMCVELVRGLRECGGWILCLTIAGAHLKQLVSGYDNNLSTALHEWNKDLQTGTLDLTDTDCANYDDSLSRLVRKILSHCQEKWMKKFDCNGESDLAKHCFTSLCVMQKQKPLPSTALSRVWGINTEKTKDMAKMLRDASLGSMQMLSVGGSFNWHVHDKLIDVSQAMTRTLGGCAAHHQRLLRGYLPDSSYIRSDPWGKCRPWWDGLQIEDGYIFENVGYHLAQGGLYEELWLLLTEIRWWLRWRQGNHAWGGISEDFKRCIQSSWTYLQSMEGMRLIHEALHQCWFGFSTNEYCLGFEMYSLLCGENFPSVQRVLAGIVQWGPSPWLQPSNRLRRRREGERSLMQIPHFNIDNYSFSVNLRYVISGNNTEIYCDVVSIFDTEELRIRMYALPSVRRCVSVSNDGGRILTRDGQGKLYLSVLKNDSTITDVALELDDVEENDVCNSNEGNDGADTIGGSTDSGSSVSDSNDIIYCAAFSRDGKRVVSGGKDGTVRLWDTEGGSGGGEVLKLEGHEGWVVCVAFSGDGKRVVSGEDDGTVRVWETEGGSGGGEVLKLEGHEGGVVCVAFSGDGKRVVSGEDDETVRVWETEGGSGGGEVLKLEGHEGGVVCVAFSGDGKRVVSGEDDGTVRVWETEGGSGGGEVLKLEGHEGWVVCVAFSGDGKRVVSGGHDGTVRLWETEGGSGGGEVLKLEGHEGRVVCVAFSGDGKRVVSGGHDGTVRVWESEGRSGGGEVLKLEGHEDWVECVAFSGDGKRVVSGGGDGTVRVWDTEGRSGGGEVLKLEGHEDWVECVAFSGDGKRVVSGGGDGTVRVWDTEGRSGGREVLKLEGHEGWVEGVAFSGDGKRVVSGGEDGTVRLWETEGGSGGGEVLKLEGHEGGVVCVAFSGDGKRVVSGGGDGTVRVWDTEGGSGSFGDVYKFFNTESDYSEVEYKKWLSTVFEFVGIDDGHEAESTRCDLDRVVKNVIGRIRNVDIFESAALGTDLIVDKYQVRARTESGVVVLADMNKVPGRNRFHWNAESKTIAVESSGRIVLCRVMERKCEDEMRAAISDVPDVADGGGLIVLAFVLGGFMFYSLGGGVLSICVLLLLFYFFMG